MKNFTFKTEKPTGRFAWVWPPSHIIKYDKKEVGSIDNETPHKIRLRVFKTEEELLEKPNCVWKSVTLKKESTSVEEAKTFLKNNVENILSKYKLFFDEN